MTFNPTEYYLWFKEYPMFLLWAIHRGLLFLPKEFYENDDSKKYDLTSKIYVFMKRLHQSYETIMQMDSDERDLLFEMEIKLIEEERKNAEKQ